jgi:hypothetical protein
MDMEDSVVVKRKAIGATRKRGFGRCGVKPEIPYYEK